jgi:GAF domain-containing protein
MIQFLAFLTTLINLLGLAICLCLGLYIVTRTPRSRISWLAALTLWSMACFYLHNTVAIHVPGSGVLPWLRPAVMLALPLGFHLVLLLPPGREPSRLDFYLPTLQLPEAIQRGLGRVSSPIGRSVVPLAYGLSVALALGGVFPFPMGIPSGEATGPLILLADQIGGPLHPLSMVYLFLFGVLAAIHLWQRRKHAAGAGCKRQYTPLFVAVLLTAFGGAYLGFGISFHLPIPSFPGDLAVGIAVILVGYMVARHNAQVEGIAIDRDLLYIGLVVGSFTIFYVVVAQVLYVGGHIFSPLTLILIILMAVTSLMLYDGLRTTVDRLFYREQFQQLRANLRALARETGVGQALPDRLQAILGALCRTLHIQDGFIALRQQDAFTCQAAGQADLLGKAFSLEALSADEITNLPRPEAEAPGGMVLLVPFFDGDNQIGALVLGPKEDDGVYGEDDLLLLEDLADQLATVSQATRLQEENAQVINEMVAQFREREHALQRQMQQMLAEREEEDRPVLAGIDEKDLVTLVEDALRRLYDYPYLGEQRLAHLRVVDWRLQGQDKEFVTHIDRGQALSKVLVQAMNKLRPEGVEPGPHLIPPREWYHFIVLRDAYVQGELNRDIMSKLYISEGTFNRTRRRAVRGVARALQEMERETQQRATT